MIQKAFWEQHGYSEKGGGGGGNCAIYVHIDFCLRTNNCILS